MQRVVILGGYGLIGSACCRAFLANGYSVTAIGRKPGAVRFTDPSLDWLFCDITQTDASQWRNIIGDADVVVNASGALQDGVQDNLSNIHDQAISRLIDALEGSATRFVQISAAGANESANTKFMRSKARGDSRLIASGLDCVILRPTLVISSDAYGGTALLRAAAAIPFINPRIYPNALIQTIGIDDLVKAVLDAAEGRIPAGTIADVTEPEQRNLDETISQIRAWLGFKQSKFGLPVPALITKALSIFADGLGWLGWRSPLRSNALRALENGITGNPEIWMQAGGNECRSLQETLQAMPVAVQERWYARMFLLLPVSIATLAFFWCATGVIALVQFSEATAILTRHSVSENMANAIVAGGSLIDILLGIAICIRPTAVKASLGMILVSIGYLIGSAFITPGLWLDPTGPMLKVLPSIPLALIIAALLEKR